MAKKKKRYENIFGTFTYRDVPSAAFPLELMLIQEGDYFCRIANPEKALCDKLYAMSPVDNATELAELLFEDLRIEESGLSELNAEKVERLSEHYHSTNVKKLEKNQIGYEVEMRRYDVVWDLNCTNRNFGLFAKKLWFDVRFVWIREVAPWIKNE